MAALVSSAGGTVTISFRVKNRGSRKGDEVAQLYIRIPIASVAQPVKALKGFKRLTLEPGEERTVRFEMPTDLLAFYGLDMKPIVEPGKVLVMVGSSSEDIRLRGEVEIVGKTTEVEQSGARFTKATVE